MTRAPLILVAGLLALGASGCQLIADFDRSKIPSDAGQLPEGGFAVDAGLDAQFPDAALDGMLPFDAGHDAATDAGDGSIIFDDGSIDDDAGTDDAG